MTNPEISASAEADAPEEQGGSAFTSSLGLYSRYIALLTAWVATCGSLFFSEVLGWQPCLMCWYQRILMYPLAIILPIGILRRDSKLHLYALPFPLIGMFVSLYHYLLIKTTIFPPPACSVSVPCTVDYIDWFGFINIPFMALTAFIIIAAMMFISMRQPFDEELDEDGEPVQRPLLSMENILVVAIIGIVVLWFAVAGRIIG